MIFRSKLIEVSKMTLLNDKMSVYIRNFPLNAAIRVTLTHGVECIYRHCVWNAFLRL